MTDRKIWAESRYSSFSSNTPEEIEDKFERNTNEHLTRVNQVRAHRRYREVNKLAEEPVPLDLLAIGDSWFDYPVADDGLPWFNQDIVAQLTSTGNTSASPAPLILRRAQAGSAMTKVIWLDNQELYLNDIADSGQWLSGKPDAILVSGGGDDMVGDQFVIYLDYFGGNLSNRVQGVIDSVEASYMALFQFRDLYAHGTPIFGHCYDYAIPNGKGVLGQGPWLWPSLKFTGYNYTQGLAIVRDAINRFHTMLSGLSATSKNLFVLVDTSGTLTRDNLQPLGFANEIHPYTAGFAALADKFIPALRSKFPGQI